MTSYVDFTQVGLTYIPNDGHSSPADTSRPKRATGSLDPSTVTGWAPAVNDKWDRTGVATQGGGGSTPVAYSRPSGAGFFRYEDSGTTDARTAFHNTPDGQNTTFPPGTFQLSDFNDLNNATKDGVRATKGNTGFSGSGIDSTFFEMVPNGSSYAYPTTTGQTNQAYIIDVFTDGVAKPQLIIQGFTLLGTPQLITKFYNGLRAAYAINPIIRQVKFQACGPGNNYFPPGETFQFTDFHCTGQLVEDCIFDGAGTGASLLAGNYSVNTTWNNCKIFSSTGRNFGMPTCYSVNGFTTNNLTSQNGHSGLNHEECGTGAIRHNNPIIAPDRTQNANSFHFAFASTPAGTGNNQNIVISWDDTVEAPTVDSFPGANGCPVFVIPDTYSSTYGSGQAQTSMPTFLFHGNEMQIIDIPLGSNIPAHVSNPNKLTQAFRFHQ